MFFFCKGHTAHAELSDRLFFFSFKEQLDDISAIPAEVSVKATRPRPLYTRQQTERRTFHRSPLTLWLRPCLYSSEMMDLMCPLWMMFSASGLSIKMQCRTSRMPTHTQIHQLVNMRARRQRTLVNEVRSGLGGGAGGVGGYLRKTPVSPVCSPASPGCWRTECSCSCCPLSARLQASGEKDDKRL